MALKFQEDFPLDLGCSDNKKKYIRPLIDEAPSMFYNKVLSERFKETVNSLLKDSKDNFKSSKQNKVLKNVKK